MCLFFALQSHFKPVLWYRPHKHSQRR